MSTTIPESVTTQTTVTTTKTVNTEPSVVVPSSSGPTVVPHSSDSTGAGSTSHEATLAEKAQAAASSAAATIASAAHTAGVHISAAAHTAGTAISKTAHDVDAKYHISEKASDVASHVGAALKHGNVTHAAKHASTAATIGEAERHKHEVGPLPAGAHVAPGASTGTEDGQTSHIASTNAPTASSSVGSTTTTTTPSLSDKASAAAATLSDKASTAASNLSASASTTAANIKASAGQAADKISNQASDAGSFASAAISQGHPVHAAQYATTAAMIGQTEREKHKVGPLENETDIIKAKGV